MTVLDETYAVPQQGVLQAALQPIVRWDGYVLGHESLLRGCDPATLFSRAEREGWRDALDRHAAGLGLRAAMVHQQRWEDLYLNAGPGRVAQLQAWVSVVVEHRGFRRGRVVMEVSEQQQLTPAVVGLLAQVRAHGLRVALDDVPLGEEGLARVRAVRPDVVKLAGEAAHTVDRPGVADQVAALVRAAGPGLVVAECVEEQWQADALVAAGVGGFQGWLMGRPMVGERPGTEGWRGAGPDTAA